MDILTQILKKCLTGVDRVSAVFAFLGSVATIGLVSVTVVAVIFRYFLNDPIFGMDDISTMTLSFIVAASIVYGGRSGSHVHVDILSMIGGKKITKYTDIVARLLSLGIVGIAAYGLFKQGSCGMPCGYFTPNLAIPYLPFYFFLGTAMGFYMIILALELIDGLVNLNAKNDTE